MTANVIGKWVEQDFRGVYRLEPFHQNDERGSFTKTYHAPQASAAGLSLQLREEYFSVSHKNVIRGMHFQNPPCALQKIVYCISGSIIDVLVDLRKAEPTFGRFATFELNATNRVVLWIPVGVAHGFQSLEDDTCVVYKTDYEYVPSADAGVRWDSFGYQWGSERYILSERDKGFPKLDEYQSPF